MSDLITVPLAHKLPAREALRLGAAEHREYKPGENITVPRASAEMLAAAAYLQCNPNDPDAVDRVLQRGAHAERPAASIPVPVPAVTPATPPQAPAAPVTASPAGTPAVASAAPQVPRT